MNKQLPQIPVLLGPTAVGKSALALELCERNNWELISCDSRQIYKGMDIGTAKPTVEELSLVPHHLISFLSPDDEYSAARWATDAKKSIEEIINRGKTPLITGGTFFYFQALREGVEHTSEINHVFRDTCRQEEEKNPGILHQRLMSIDPARAEMLHPHDIQRIIRALFICETKDVLSSQKKFLQEPSPYDFTVVSLFRKREQLYKRINQRVDMMLEQGLLKEFEQLLSQGYHKESPGLKCVGYQEFFNYIDKSDSLEGIADTIKQHSRRYAKRQLTWLRNKQQADLQLDITHINKTQAIEFIENCYREVK